MSIKFNNTILNYYDNTNEIINIYMNQSKSKWLEIPLNQCNSEYVSPFHFKIVTDDILSILEYVEKVIFHLFEVDNLEIQQNRHNSASYLSAVSS